MPDSWMWHPNADVTRLHAVRFDQTLCPDADGLYVVACGRQPLAGVPVTGHQPPRCKRCSRIAGGSDA